MQEHHIPIKINFTYSLHVVFDVQVVTLLEQNGCMVNENSV